MTSGGFHDQAMDIHEEPYKKVSHALINGNNEGLLCPKDDSEGLLCPKEDNEGLSCPETKDSNEGLLCPKEKKERQGSSMP